MIYHVVSKLLNFLNVGEVDVKPTPNRPRGLRAVSIKQRWPFALHKGGQKHQAGMEASHRTEICGREIGCNLMKMMVTYRTIQSERLDRMCQYDYNRYVFSFYFTFKNRQSGRTI